MQLIIEKLLNDFERGSLTRRQLAAALAALATGAQAASKKEELKAVTLSEALRKGPGIVADCAWPAI